MSFSVGSKISAIEGGISVIKSTVRICFFPFNGGITHTCKLFMPNGNPKMKVSRTGTSSGRRCESVYVIVFFKLSNRRRACATPLAM